MSEREPERELRVLGIAGSLRQRSYNRALLRAALELAPPAMRIEVFEGLGELPLLNEDLEGQLPAPVVRLKEAIARAEALLIVAPEYNYGVTAPLKNAIDWATRPPGTSVLRGKPAALMGASPGAGGTIRAQLALRQAFVNTETYAMLRPEVLVARAHEKFDAELRLVDPATRESVAKLLTALVPWARRFLP
jgi:chromate reductase